MNIRTVVIDIEPVALSLIQQYVKGIPYLDCVGCFCDPMSALPLIKKGDADLICLDVNLAHLGIIDSIRSMNRPPKIILVADDDEYAVQAFEIGAIDYLLKPVAFGRFLTATAKVRDLMNATYKREDFIFVRSEHSLIKVELDKIDYIEGYKDYLKIYTNMSRPILTIATLKSVMELLPSNFLRIHKSYVVAVDKIVSFRNGKVAVRDRHLPIGDCYRSDFNRVVIDGRLAN
jgi:two-component system, LytTR family, response regulator